MTNQIKPEFQEDDDAVISLRDVWQICKKGRKKIVFGTLFFGIIFGFLSLISPISYEAKATFKEKGKSNPTLLPSGLNSFLTNDFGSQTNSEAISTMKSRKILEQVVGKLGLQAHIIPSGFGFKFQRLANIRDNLLTEYALFMHKKIPALEDSSPLIGIRHIKYDGEIPLHFKLQFLSERNYEVYNSNGSLLGKGILNIPFQGQGVTFTITSQDASTPDVLTSQQFHVTLLSRVEIAEELSKTINVVIDQKDKHLITLKYSNSNRHLAASSLNTLMQTYQNYLKNEQQYYQNKQIDYLQARQDEMQNKLRSMMEKHAGAISSDLELTGFPDTKSALEFFGRAQEGYQKQLLLIDFEMARLEKSLTNENSEGSTLIENNASEVIGEILTQIRRLKQHSDSIELALITSPNNIQENLQTSFEEHYRNLEEIKLLSKDAKETLAAIQTGNLPKPGSKLFQEPNYFVGAWCEKLNGLKSNEQDFKECSANFSSYLSNLIHLFQVHEKSIHERLIYRQSPQKEFQGLDLSMTKEIHLEGNKQLNETEALLLQHQFILHQMENPEFEISSLSSILKDFVSQEIVKKSSDLALNLNDLNNRSSKEQERLKEGLSVQKGFLSLHLKQTIQLLQLKLKLLQEKIEGIQKASLEIIQREISVLQENLRGYIATRIDNLKQERKVIEQHQRELGQEMSKLPSKWVEEKLINQQMDLNKHTVEEVTRLVETKNITGNLELIQSAPLDLALAPLHPRSPHLLLFIIGGAILGSILSSGFVIMRTLSKGLPATADSLKLAKQHVSGNLSPLYQKANGKPLFDQDIETLRRLIAFLNSEPISETDKSPSSKIGRQALLITGKGPDCSQDVAAMLAKKGQKVLLVSLSFDKSCSEQELPGLMQFLEKETLEIKINQGGEFDWISSGGISRFASELIGSQLFIDLMQKLKLQYDWIIGVSHALPDSAEAESLLHIFDLACFTITEETLQSLQSSIHFIEYSGSKKQISFIIAQANCGNIRKNA